MTVGTEEPRDDHQHGPGWPTDTGGALTTSVQPRTLPEPLLSSAVSSAAQEHCVQRISEETPNPRGREQLTSKLFLEAHPARQLADLSAGASKSLIQLSVALVTLGPGWPEGAGLGGAEASPQRPTPTDPYLQHWGEGSALELMRRAVSCVRSRGHRTGEWNGSDFS